MTGLHNLQEDFLYRALRTDEDPYRDIVCKDPNSNRTIDEHVKDGLKFASKYISTTAKFELAQTWIETSVRKSIYKRGTTIIKIDVKYLKNNYPDLVNSAYNFTNDIVRSSNLSKDSCNYARKYEEVVFERFIPSKAICDMYVEGKGWIGAKPPRIEPTMVSTANTPLRTPKSTPIPDPTSRIISPSPSPTSQTSLLPARKRPSLYSPDRMYPTLRSTKTTPISVPTSRIISPSPSPTSQTSLLPARKRPSLYSPDRIYPTLRSTKNTPISVPTSRIISPSPSPTSSQTSLPPARKRSSLYSPDRIYPTLRSTKSTPISVPTSRIISPSPSPTSSQTSLPPARIYSPLHSPQSTPYSHVISPTISARGSSSHISNSLFDICNISNSSISTLDMSADASDSTSLDDTTVKRSITGVKRRNIHSDVKPSKYSCLDKS